MSKRHLIEIFPIVSSSRLNAHSFGLSPEIDRKTGNSFGWHFSKKFPGIVVIWERGYFWILAQPDIDIPSIDEWKATLEEIQTKQKNKLGDRAYFIRWVNSPQLTPSVIAQLAVRVLQIHCRFTQKTVLNENQVRVDRECNFWAETFEFDYGVEPAIALTPKSVFLYKETLEHFFNNHPYRNDPEKLLIDLLVRDIESNSTATIVEINGTIGEHRDRLIEQATGSISKEKLHLAPAEQPVVSIKFRKDTQSYDYAMAALRPCVTAKTAAKFDVEYGELLKKTKIFYQERQQLLSQYKRDAENILTDFGLKFTKQCVNSKDYSDLFWIPETKLEDTQLLFGDDVRKKRSQTLTGLSEGGVYRRHREFQNPARKIRFAALNFSSLNGFSFFKDLEKRLDDLKFQVSLAPENIRRESLEGLSKTESKVRVQTLVDEVVQVPPDIVLVFLPESDRQGDDSDGESIYGWVYRRLLRRKIASQVIYEKTLREQSKFVLNQVVPGILAKLGNLPFVLAEPLSIADYFIGLDISRRSKKNTVGSVNACASLRLYGKQGEFIRYQLADDSISEGEEIPKRILQEFLPIADLTNKKVLIYRDGVFRGDEIENLLAWGKAINSEFILVECAKSQIPRLYDVVEKRLQQPTRGLALQISSLEAILITTQVNQNVGVPRPLRLKIIRAGAAADLKNLVDATLKLTLLHHGSLKDPRLPIPLFGADRIAYRRLQGIYPGDLEGDKQYWL